MSAASIPSSGASRISSGSGNSFEGRGPVGVPGALEGAPGQAPTRYDWFRKVYSGIGIQVAAPKVLASQFDVWMLAITIVIGGQMYDWNSGLHVGFGSFLVAAFITTCGYMCLTMCLAEMTSILPFSGGGYGFARVAVNIFWGYIIGCCEMIEYILYVSSTVLPFGELLTEILGTEKRWEPLYWLVFYCSAIFIQVWGGNIFWKASFLLGTLCFLIIAFYCISMIPIMDFNEHARSADPAHPWFAEGAGSILRILPLSSWWFLGIEATALVGQEAQQPKKSVPRALAWAVVALTVTGWALYFSSVSVGPSTTEFSNTSFPLTYGFSSRFNISIGMSKLFTLPCIYTTSFGFLFSYGRLVSAMSESGLLPRALSITTPGSGTPIVALIFASTLGFGFALIAWNFNRFRDVLYNTCALGSYLAHITTCISFIAFRLYYDGLQNMRQFESPLGITGAVIGILVFMLCGISVSFFQDDQYVSIIIFSVYIALATIFYIFVARDRQRFSHQEKSVMLVAHVMKANMTGTAGRHRTHNEYALLDPIIDWLQARIAMSWRGGDAEVPRLRTKTKSKKDDDIELANLPVGPERIRIQMASEGVSLNEKVISEFVQEMESSAEQLSAHAKDAGYMELYAAVRDALNQIELVGANGGPTSGTALVSAPVGSHPRNMPSMASSAFDSELYPHSVPPGGHCEPSSASVPGLGDRGEYEGSGASSPVPVAWQPRKEDWYQVAANGQMISYEQLSNAVREALVVAAPAGIPQPSPAQSRRSSLSQMDANDIANLTPSGAASQAGGGGLSQADLNYIASLLVASCVGDDSRGGISRNSSARSLSSYAHGSGQTGSAIGSGGPGTGTGTGAAGSPRYTRSPKHIATPLGYGTPMG